MKTWTVTFVGDYFAMTTVVSAKSARKAEKEAMDLLESYYGWDMDSLANEINVEQVD